MKSSELFKWNQAVASFKFYFNGHKTSKQANGLAFADMNLTARNWCDLSAKNASPYAVASGR